MAMTEYKTRTGIETVAEGELKAIFFNELKTKKDYGTNGKSWIPTHSVNIIVDEDRISLGLTDKDVLRVKDAEGNYHDLTKGQKISVVVEPNGEWQGVQQWQGRTSDVIVLEQAPAGQQASGGSQKAYTPQKRDNSGMSTGHAINVAMNVLGDVSNPEAIIEAAKKAHDLTTKMKEEYAGKNPDMSEYDLGAMVGQSVLSASHYAESVEDIEDIARQTLDVVVPAVSEYVKGTKEAPKTAVKKTATKKTVAKKTTKKAEPTPSRVDDDDIPESAFVDDLDDDIPF